MFRTLLYFSRIFWFQIEGALNVFLKFVLGVGTHCTSNQTSIARARAQSVMTSPRSVKFPSDVSATIHLPSSSSIKTLVESLARSIHSGRSLSWNISTPNTSSSSCNHYSKKRYFRISFIGGQKKVGENNHDNSY